LTTAIFRCPGWARPASAKLEALGWHDLAFWLVLVSLGAAWYFFMCEPQRERNELLAGRLETLRAQLRAEQDDLARLRREIAGLKKGEPAAWERAARARLGWLKPGEVLDIAAWRREQIMAGRGDPFAAAPSSLPNAQPPRNPPATNASRPPLSVPTRSILAERRGASRPGATPPRPVPAQRTAERE
jgi:hypothetical protein